jgi:hypothetical protein
MKKASLKTLPKKAVTQKKAEKVKGGARPKPAMGAGNHNQTIR